MLKAYKSLGREGGADIIQFGQRGIQHILIWGGNGLAGWYST